MKVGIIGFGNLGKALAKGLIYKKLVSKDEIFILAKSEKTKELAEKEFQVQVCSDINDVIEKTNILFWVLKGNIFDELSKNINKDVVNKINVSFMAGVPIASMQKRLGDVYITRAMPSIAIAKANGVIGYTKTNNIFVEKIFHELGYAFEIEEKDIEKVTAFSACGLGFATYILNAFQKSGQAFGFDPKVSKEIVAKTFENAIDMPNYEEATGEVATKGGATEQGIIYFEENNLNKIINNAINKAYNKIR